MQDCEYKNTGLGLYITLRAFLWELWGVVEADGWELWRVFTGVEPGFIAANRGAGCQLEMEAVSASTKTGLEVVCANCDGGRTESSALFLRI